MILGVDLQNKNRNEFDNNGRVLILSTMGFIGNANKKLAPFREEVTRNKNILIADKYTLKAEEITQKGADGKTTSSSFWKKISDKAESMSTIIITNFSPLVSTKPLAKSELDAKYRSSLKLLNLYADLYKKNIIIIEDEEYSMSILSNEVEPKNIFEVHLENNNLFIKESANGNTDKILIRLSTAEIHIIKW
jgi:UDP-N-acetylmuramate-alanine ligase